MRGLHWKRCLVYIDDILVFGNDFECALHNLELVLDRVHKQENIAALKNKLANTDFSSVIECNSPDESYNTFINSYQKAYDSACPEKLIKLSKKS